MIGLFSLIETRVCRTKLEKNLSSDIRRGILKLLSVFREKTGLWASAVILINGISTTVLYNGH